MTGHIRKLIFKIFLDKKLFWSNLSDIYMFLTFKFSSSLELLNLIFLLFRGDTDLLSLCHFVLDCLQCSFSCLFNFSLLSDFLLINSNINLCYAKERKKEKDNRKRKSFLWNYLIHNVMPYFFPFRIKLIDWNS